jgi:hypothetical protein
MQGVVRVHELKEALDQHRPLVVAQLTQRHGIAEILVVVGVAARALSRDLDGAPAGAPSEFSARRAGFFACCSLTELTPVSVGVRWIGTLQALADAWPGWRAQKERAHVFAQFEEARETYRRLGRGDVGR